MKSLALALCLVSSLAWSQGNLGVAAPVVINGVGQPLPGAQVAICAQNPGATPNPPCQEAGNSLVTTFTTLALTGSCSMNPATLGPLNGTGCTNPGLTDAYGNMLIYGGPGGGPYWYEVYGNAITTYAAPLQFGGTPTIVVTTTIQNAINSCPTSGCAIWIPASTVEYACPTSIPGNVALIGLGSFAENNFVGSIITSTTKTQVLIGPCGAISIAADSQNIRLQNLTLDFNDSGNGLAFVSGSFLQLSGLTLLNAGGASTPALSLTSTGASGLLNSIRNVFDHLSIKCSSTQTCNAAIYLNGSANTGVTDNEFYDVAISGSPKCGVELEKNTDSNHFVNGNYLPDTIVSGSAPFCFNLSNPTVDIDADASEFVNWNITGTPTYGWNAGQSQGHTFVGLNSVPANSSNFHVAGGSPLYPMVLMGAGGTGAVFMALDEMQLHAGIFASLPACSAAYHGQLAAVNDSTTNTWGATITGSGADHVLAYCDGTNWTVAAK